MASVNLREVQLACAAFWRELELEPALDADAQPFAYYSEGVANRILDEGPRDEVQAALNLRALGQLGRRES